MYAYIFQADIWCEDCGKAIAKTLPHDEDSDRYPQGPYPDGGGEADCPQHCGGCRAFLENDLTEDGENYVRECCAEGSANSHVLDQWREFYDYLFTNEED